VISNSSPHLVNDYSAVTTYAITSEAVWFPYHKKLTKRNLSYYFQ